MATPSRGGCSHCCPSRAGFLTGLYTHNHKVWSNTSPNGGAEAFNDTSTLATWLNQTGYTNALIGKYLNQYGKIRDHIPPGWHEWHAQYEGGYYNYTMNENGVAVRYGSTPSDYSVDVVTQKAVDFISTTKKPFFLWMSLFAPHSDPLNDTYPTPAPRYANTCDDIPAPRPPSFNEEDMSDKPSWIKHIPKLNSSEIEINDKIWKEHVCSLKAVDESISAVMNSLGPEINNTIIFFTSDNGLALGEHRISAEKFCSYEECYRVPLVVYYPKMISGDLQSDALVLNIDITATILDLTQTDPHSKINGKSLVPLMANDHSAQWRDASFYEQFRKYATGNIWTTAIRTSDYVYLEHFNNDTKTIAFREFYDLTTDPYQLANSIDNPSYSSTIDALSKRLTLLRQE